MAAVISSNKKIAKNTILLYVRMVVVMGVSLFTSRINLESLGIENNGIYQVVGGLVTTFTFLNSSLAGATSRFITFELGVGDNLNQRRIFSASFEIHLFLAFLILILAETIGLWYLNNKMVIPEKSMYAANVVYQLSIFTTAISIVRVPYMSTIIAHEKMGAFAYMSILDVCLGLGTCYYLFITPFDKLITYAVLMASISVLISIIYIVYCYRRFECVKLIFIKDFTIIKPMLSFSAWDLFGNFSVMARSYGVNLIMNLFFGPVINSAVGFATSVGGSIRSFSNNFLTAIRPSITKSYAQNGFEEMQNLLINASKFSFVLLLVFTIPFMFEGQFIVKMWLKTPPPYTSIFATYDLLLGVFSTLFLPLVYVIHATGHIRFMSVVNGLIWLMVVPMTYVILHKGGSPITPYVLKLLLLVGVVISNIYNTKKLIPSFNVRIYFKKAIFPALLCFFSVLLIVFCIHSSLTNEISRFIITCLSSVIVTAICTWRFLFERNQRKRILDTIINLCKRKCID